MRYHGRTCGLDEPTNWVPQQMITTRENIVRFFQPRTYKGDRETRCASRDSFLSGKFSTTRKAKMSRDELLVKFKLAAELNGIEWSEFAARSLLVGCPTQNPKNM